MKNRLGLHVFLYDKKFSVNNKNPINRVFKTSFFNIQKIE